MVDCEHWKNHTCGVVAKLTGCCQRLCNITPEACAVCLASEQPRALNRVTASIGMAVARQFASAEQWPDIRDRLAPAITIEKPKPTAGGPGTELKRMLSKFGLNERPGCNCKSHVREMDHRGTAWCRANVDTIIGWLREEAAEQGLPFVDMAARMLIFYAIRRADK